MSLSYRNEIPYIEEKSLSDLTQLIQTPFYVYSQKIITEFFLKLKKNLQKDIYYSVKANSNQAIISLLTSLGAGADVVSIEELKRVIKAGVSKNKIIYEGVGKSENDLSYAIKNEIKQINIESIEELHLIDKIANSLNQKPNVGIRINPHIDAQTLDKISTGRKTDKFGIDFNQLEEIIEILKSMKNINFSGLSCHAGSQMSDLKIYEKIFIKIIQAIKIFESHNLKIENLNLGGGLSVVYEKNQNEFEVNKLAKLLEKFFPKSNYKISFEPGRYLVANAGFLITKILTTKKNGDVNFLITDAGMQTFLRPSMYNVYHKILSFNQSEKKLNYTIAGPICESSDIISKNVQLPIQKKDNFLIICDTGAYGSVMASNYNSKCLPAEILINEKDHALIRNSQNIDNIIERDQLPHWLKIN